MYKRQDARSVRLQKESAKQLALKLADSITFRLQSIWKPVNEAAARWRPNEDNTDNESDRPMQHFHQPRRTLLFHISAVFDVNECELDFLDMGKEEREDYFKLLYSSIAREVVELDSKQTENQERLAVLFSMFHDNMRKTLHERGRRSPAEALNYWRQQNEESVMISPMPFNLLARSCLSCQASSCLSERVFSDLGRLEGSQSQSLLTSTLEMKELIKSFTCAQLRIITLTQSTMLHPEAVAFKRLVNKIAEHIHRRSVTDPNSTEIEI